MDRIELVRDYVDKMLLNRMNTRERRDGYVHLYGVSQACAMLAMIRKENVELATIAGMLHDIYTYSMLDETDHAHKGAAMAKDILEALGAFTADESALICTAIYHHSSKGTAHTAFDEVLKDADVLQHCLYQPLYDAIEYDRERFEQLKVEMRLV